MVRPTSCVARVPMRDSLLELSVKVAPAKNKSLAELPQSVTRLVPLCESSHPFGTKPIELAVL